MKIFFNTARMNSSLKSILLFSFGLVISPVGYADNQVSQIPFSDSASGSVGLGAGFRFGVSPYKHIDTISSDENDNNADLIPLYLYEGQYIFSHGTRAGIHLWKENVEFDALIQYRFDRLETDADEFYDGVNDRKQTLEGGFAATVKKNWGDLTLTWLADLQSRHNGYEIDLTYRYNWKHNRWSVSPFISLIHQNEDLTQYYYEVTEQESRDDLSVYTPDSVVFSRIGLNTSYRLFDHWLLFANISFENLADEIKNSPLVDESSLSTMYLGFSYEFGNVFTPSSNSIDVKDWSWRIHSGYTAESTFTKVHQGEFKRSEDVHTYLAGLTLGKLLNDGDKIDFWGKVSFNRRLENDYQDNFWEYNAYVMAMGKGYSPWSNKEIFRYGFGFGFSYAERIPVIEQVKQERKGANTAHFLNYMEAQLDFPVANLFEHKSVRNCYIGLTIIHRSGIFATSDLLGNVSGGSDVLAGHLECKR